MTSLDPNTEEHAIGRRMDDQENQIKKIWVRFPVLFWTIIALWCSVIVIFVGGAIALNRINDNSNNLAKSVCAQVDYLNNIADQNPQATAEQLKPTLDLAKRQASLANCDVTPPKPKE